MNIFFKGTVQRDLKKSVLAYAEWFYVNFKMAEVATPLNLAGQSFKNRSGSRLCTKEPKSYVVVRLKYHEVGCTGMIFLPCGNLGIWPWRHAGG